MPLFVAAGAANGHGIALGSGVVNDNGFGRLDGG
jgi:hypothetical protein